MSDECFDVFRAFCVFRCQEAIPFQVCPWVRDAEAPGSYFGSALCLFRKRLALIAEAPCSYFGSAVLLSAKSRSLSETIQNFLLLLSGKDSLTTSAPLGRWLRRPSVLPFGQAQAVPSPCQSLPALNDEVIEGAGIDERLLTGQQKFSMKNLVGSGECCIFVQKLTD